MQTAAKLIIRVTHDGHAERKADVYDFPDAPGVQARIQHGAFRDTPPAELHEDLAFIRAVAQAAAAGWPEARQLTLEEVA